MSGPDDPGDPEAGYEPVIERVRAVEDAEPPAGWQARAEERWRRETPRRRRWPLALGAAATAVAIAAIAVFTCRTAAPPRRPPAPLAVMLQGADGAPRRGDGLVGDTWKLRAGATHAHVELRVYRDRALIARCPGDARCTTAAGGPAIDVRLDEPGAYRAVSLAGAAPIPPPTADGLESDLLAARQAGVTITRTDAMTVPR